ncbi:hypothetical protein SLS62_002292 [Diatrype stigma]|uniref:Cytochrome P450 n=1 Tax=Diatrype stigma TaxID=117547 RepID=A0AAN9UXI2_9PEZI
MGAYSIGLTDAPVSLIVATLVFVGALLWPRLIKEVKLRHFPLVGEEHNRTKRVRNYFFSAATVYQEGYQKFKEKIHRLTTLSARLTGRLTDEVERAVKSELPQCDDWTPVKITDPLLNIVTIVSGLIFLGPDLCRQPEYIRAAVDYTIDITNAVGKLKEWPWWMRPIMSRIIPEVVRLGSYRKEMKVFLEPVIKERGRLKAAGEPLPDDTLQWLLNRAEAAGITDIADITHMQLLLTMAAIHTTTLTATRILYDLAAHPDAVEAIRKEIRAVLNDNGGVMTTKALFDMKLTDSVMRESQRLNPPFSDGFRRYTLKPITLKDGTYIPAHSYIEAANTPALQDPNHYPNPEEFDPYRFYKLRTTDVPDPIGYRNREQYQFVSVTKENMSFGFGRHACPGRFFAANEIKLILARLLLDYDVKMPEGVETPYKNLSIGVVNATDVTKEILLRRGVTSKLARRENSCLKEMQGLPVHNGVVVSALRAFLGVLSGFATLHLIRPQSSSGAVRMFINN